jgi:hypothetical protein
MPVSRPHFPNHGHQRVDFHRAAALEILQHRGLVSADLAGAVDSPLDVDAEPDAEGLGDRLRFQHDCFRQRARRGIRADHRQMITTSCTPSSAGLSVQRGAITRSSPPICNVSPVGAHGGEASAARHQTDIGACTRQLDTEVTADRPGAIDADFHGFFRNQGGYEPRNLDANPLRRFDP